MHNSAVTCYEVIKSYDEETKTIPTNFNEKKVICKMQTFKIKDFDFDNTLIDKKSHKNVLVYKILHKIFNDYKPLRIRFDKIDGFIKVYDGTRYLVLFGSEKHDSIYNRLDIL